MEGKNCLNCKYRFCPSSEEPCKSCSGLSKWGPVAKWLPGDAMIELDQGAPEGDKTNARQVWVGKSGPELIVREGVPSVDQLTDGLLEETARAVAKQITRLDYAIEGVRSKISSIGIKFTDKDLSRDEIDLLVGQLNALQLDLFELEEERKAMMEGGEHGNGND